MATAPYKAKALEEQKSWLASEVPPFPAVALKALNLMAGMDTSLIDLCNLIRPDAAFSTEVLRIANSPLVAFSKNVSSVLQASMLLGFRRLRSVVITVGLKVYLSEPYSPLLHACWHHSLASAIIAERAAKACAHDKDFAFTSGVMHDIGRMVMAVSRPSAYAHVVEQGANEPRDLLRAEREICGIDHCQAGAALVKEWALPESLSWITASHHDLDSPVVGVDSIVRHSCLLADSLGFAIVGYRTAPGYAQILAGFPEPALRSFPADRRQLVSEINGQIKVIESA